MLPPSPTSFLPSQSFEQRVTGQTLMRFTHSYRMWNVPLLLGFLLLFPALVLGQSKTRWTGASNNQWRNPLNWTAGVPSPALDVAISESAPLVNEVFVPKPEGADTAQILNLALSNDGVLRFDSLGVLLVWGTDKLQNLGEVYLGYGTIIFKNKMTFHNGGMFDAGAGSLSFEGVAWESKSGSNFLPGTSTVTFNKLSDQSLIVDSTLNLSFYDLVFDTQGEVTINGNVTVLHSLTIAEGCTLIVPTGSSLTVQGAFINNGTITGGGTYPGSLPVQMVSLQISSERLDAILRWTTATEVNNLGFAVERRTVSKGVVTSWHHVGFVPGLGTSSSPHEYLFVDANVPAGRYAYRIKQVDLNGAAAYFTASEVEIGLAPKKLFLGDNYPNPFNPATSIEFTFPENARASLRVFNMIGQEVAILFDQFAEAGRLYRAHFSASSLPSGLYFYRLEFGNQSIVRKMMLVK